MDYEEVGAKVVGVRKRSVIEDQIGEKTSRTSGPLKRGRERDKDNGKKDKVYDFM